MFSGESAQNRQPSGFSGEHTFPGGQPQVRFDLMSNMGASKSGGFVGAAQTVDAGSVNVSVCVAVSVVPGNVLVST